MIGVEPTWITPPDPKSGASANFATSGNYIFLSLVRLLPPWREHIRLRGAKVRDLYKIWKGNMGKESRQLPHFTGIDLYHFPFLSFSRKISVLRPTPQGWLANESW